MHDVTAITNHKGSDLGNRLDRLEQKLDTILFEIQREKARNESAADLGKELSVVANDLFHSISEELDKQGVQLSLSDVSRLLIELIHNLPDIIGLLRSLEELNDLLKDAGPIVNDLFKSMVPRLDELDRKGYFEFFRETISIIDNILSTYSAKDVRELADNVVTILETVRNMTQPDMLKAMNNGIRVYKNLDTRDIPEYSLWKALRELNSPELKKGIGFMITFLKNIARERVNGDGKNIT